MQCVMCGQEMKLVPAGKSKKSGKAYDAFFSCECGETFNPPKNSEVRTSILQDKPKTNGNNSVKTMVFAYAKDIVVALIRQGLAAPNPTEQVIGIYRLFLKEIESL